jgi:hypothetical protein
MIFNDKWTKEVNDQYRKMIKEKKSYDEIKENLGDLMNYHPKNKFKFESILSYNRFQFLIKEITFYPKYIYFEYNNIQSLRYEDQNDIICFFEISNIEYVLLLECLIENNNSFNNQIVYNIFFTTKEQYNNFIKIISKLTIDEIENKFIELQEIVEKQTLKDDAIKIFNALSYILLKMKNHIKNCTYMISETDDYRKFNFYKQSIEESFTNNYQLIVEESLFFPNR